MRTRRLTALIGCLILSASASLSHAEDTTPAKPAWQYLPSSTIVAMQLPNGQAFADALRQRTRLGRELFAQERIEKLKQIIVEQAGDEWDEFSENLARYNLSSEDWPALFNGPMGMAVTMIERTSINSDEPLFVLIGWMEPGEDLATRLHNALLQSIEDQNQDEDQKVTRIDVELAGRAVTHLAFPEMGMDREPNWNTPEGFQQMTPEQQEAHWQQQEAIMEAAKLVEIDRTHLLITRMGGRLVCVIVPPQSDDLVREKLAAGVELPWDALTGSAEAADVMGRFLTAHDEQAPGWAQHVMATPGIDAAMTKGEPVLEMAFDLDPLFTLARAAAETDDDAREITQVMALFGLSEGHTGLYRFTLDGSILRGGMFFSAKTPRSGLMQLLDQQPLDSQPPAWVSSQTMGYTQISFDLANAYHRIKEMSIKVFGDSAQAGFTQVETTFQGFTMAELPAVLASLGSQHTILTYGMKMVKVEQPDYEAEPDPQTGQWPMTTVEQPQQHLAMVWQVGDEALWQRLMQVIGNFSVMTGGAIQPAEEQGFTGYRLDQSGVKAGLMLGKGHLVYAIGDGVTEQVLAMLRSTPEDADRLRNSQRYRDAAALLDLRPSLLFSVEDAGRNLGSAFDMLFKGIEMGMTAEGADASVIDGLRELMPTSEQLQEMVSTNASIVYTTDDGLVMQTALRLAPAE